MRPRIRRGLVAVAAVLAAALTARLGVWQLDRAAQKTRLQQALQRQQALPPLVAGDLARDAATAAAQHGRAIVLAGRWEPAWTVYLENRQMNGRPGFFDVLVQRGWLPRDPADRVHIALPPLPGGAVQVRGRIAPAPSRLFDFAGAASGPIRQNLELAAFSSESGLLLRPLSIVQEDGLTPLSDGLLRQWPQPAADVSRNYGYAFQWFAMSALIIGLYAWFQLIRPRWPRRA
jgi:surfeit locus 1 family protein